LTGLASSKILAYLQVVLLWARIVGQILMEKQLFSNMTLQPVL